MRLNRFYSERKNLRVSSSVRLPDSDIKHIRNVLRLKKGDKIVVFNGEKEFLAELKIVSSEFVTAKIIKIIGEETPSDDGVNITIFQSLLRAGKFDYIVEKATELGVDFIIPVETEFSQMKIDVAQKKVERWNKIAISASKQSARIRIPEVLEPIKFSDISSYLDNFDLKLFFTIPKGSTNESMESSDLKEFIEKNTKSHKSIAIFIGPEGGFSPNEHKLAKESELTFVKYGRTALRSETAAIAFLSIIKYIYSV